MGPIISDVTDRVKTENPDDESCPLMQCVCGMRFGLWDVVLSIYSDDPKVMSCCGRKLYFQNSVKVFEVLS